MLCDPKGNSVSSVPGENVAFAEDDVFKGVGRQAVLADDVHAVFGGGWRQLSRAVGVLLGVSRDGDGGCQGCRRRRCGSNKAAKAMHAYIRSRSTRHATALI